MASVALAAATARVVSRRICCCRCSGPFPSSFPSTYSYRSRSRCATLTTAASTGESRPEKRVAVLPASLSSLGLKYLEADELRERFDEYDVNKDGHICENEAVQLLVDAGMKREDADRAAREVVHSISGISGDDSNNAELAVDWADFKAAVDRAAEPVSKKVWPISGSLLLNFSGQGVTWPVLTPLVRSVGLGASELGMVTGASALARICSNVPAAALAERAGRKPLLVLGPVIGSVGYLGYALGGDTFGALVAASALTGIGGAMTSAGSGLFLSDISTPLNRARTMSPLMTTALLGFAIGPALGGFMAETFDLHAPFLVTAAGMGCASVSAMALLPETLRRKQVRGKVAADTLTNNKGRTISLPESAPKQWLALLRLQSMQGISAVALMSGALQGAGPVTGILFATETLGMSPGELGAMFTFQVLAMSVMIQPATALSDRYRNKMCRSLLMLPGLAASAVILAAQPFCTSILPFAGLGTLRAVGDALCVMPNVTPLIMDSTTDKQRAQALAMRNMSQDVGILLGSTSMGALAQLTTVPTAMFVIAGLQAAVTVFFFNRTQDSRRRRNNKGKI